MTEAHVFTPLDATLGLDGLPQSGTGQASLYTGVNASALAGRHYGPHAPTAAYPVLASHGMWARLQDRGVTAERLAFATAYPERFFAYGERTGRWPTAARMARACGVRLRSEQDVRDGTAFTAEITGEAWRERLGLNVPVHTPSEAGRLLASLAAAHTVTLYEYYDTDTVGHSRELERAAEVLARVDAFLGGLLDAFDVDRGLILVTSDHGNLEDLSVKTHTRNPVPLVAWGTGAGAFAECQALTDVTPKLVALMTEAS
ncbi:MAG TPA: alkaline phosphatase family protein [Rhodothermales bacterium]|nr:alkaline phosphatase family protein [Rhodothermales bacterium]